MLILTLRTDKPEAEIGLYDDHTQLAYVTWQAHRALAETLLQKIEDMLNGQGEDWTSIEGIVSFQGPGSFTGLRIGLTVANTLSYSLGKPVVATKDPRWLESGIDRLLAGSFDKAALPFYGAEANITQQKK